MNHLTQYSTTLADAYDVISTAATMGLIVAAPPGTVGYLATLYDPRGEPIFLGIYSTRLKGETAAATYMINSEYVLTAIVDPKFRLRIKNTPFDATPKTWPTVLHQKNVDTLIEFLFRKHLDYFLFDLTILPHKIDDPVF